jgi:hypothetical protein
MENQIALVIQSQGLTKLSKTNMVLAEQDKGQTIKLICFLLQRLSKLYQLPNWSEENALILAEWIFDNYKFDSLDDVITCLKNPPQTGNKNWRLTPDTIQEWMTIVLEKRAEKREIENKKLKESFIEELPNVDYDAFKTKIEKEGLPEEKPQSDLAYEKFRMQYLIAKQKTEEKKD